MGYFRFRSPLLTESMLSFCSCGYLDVSVPRVRPQPPMRSAVGDGCCEHPPGFPIRTPPDQRSFASSPELFAGCRVLRRLSMPRHPPYTLNRLTTFIDHRLIPARTQPGRRGGERPRVSPKRCPTTPALRKDTLSPPGGDHRGGSAGAGVADSPGRAPRPTCAADHSGLPITLNLVIHLSKSSRSCAAPASGAGATGDKLPAERG